MKSKPFITSILLLALFAFACNKPPANPPSELESAKAELLKVLKNEGSAPLPKFEAFEDENAVVTIFKSKNENDTLHSSAEKLKKGILLGVFRVKNKKNSQTDTYKSVLVVQDSSAFLSIVNVDKKTEEKVEFGFFKDIDNPPPPPPPLPPCDIDACIDYFNTNIRPGLQAQANSTCKDIIYCIICPVDGPPCVAITFLIKPTRWRCLIATDFSVKHYGLKTLPLGVGITPK